MFERRKMLLGKRSRPPMKRTTSMTEFTMDLSSEDTPLGGGEFVQNQGQYSSQVPPVVSPRITSRRNSSDSIYTTHFLRSCSLCRRRLLPGRDIYMYKGDSAFCSLECREQQMNQDEKKEKCAVASKTKAPSAGGSAGGAPSVSQVVSAKGEIVTAM